MLLLATLASAAEPPARIAHFVEHDGQCRWEAVAIGADALPVTLAELPGPCAVGAVRASPDGRRALIELTTREPDGGLRLYEVDLTGGAVASVGPVPVQYTSGIGYGTDGAPRVFATVSGTPSGGTPRRPQFLSYGGRTYDTGGDGNAVIAVEYARRGNAWVLVGSVLSEVGFCGARDVGALPNYRSTTRDNPVPAWLPATAAEVAALQAGSGYPIERFQDGAWLVQRGRDVALGQWSDQIEGLSPSIVLLVEVGRAWRPLIADPLEAGMLTVRTRGVYTLVIAYDLVTPPRVFDLRDGRLVWTETDGDLAGWSPR